MYQLSNADLDRITRLLGELATMPAGNTKERNRKRLAVLMIRKLKKKMQTNGNDKDNAGGAGGGRQTRLWEAGEPDLHARRT